MKYNICGFDQRALCRFAESNKDKKQQLDCTDLVILKWIADFSVRSSVTKVIIDGNQYAWVVYNTIVDDLPFISISKRAFADRFDKLHAYGLIEKRVEKRSGMGTFLYVRILPKYEELLYNNNNDKERSENKEGCSSNSMGDAVRATGGMRFEQQPDAVQAADKYNTTIQENYKQNVTSTIVDVPSENASAGKKKNLSVIKEKKEKKYSAAHRCRLAFEQQYLQFKGEEYYYAAKDANAVKQLIDKIKTKMPDEDKDNDDAIAFNFDAFIQAILNSGRVEKWIIDNFSLPVINSKFNEIYSQLKNGTARQQQQQRGPSDEYIQRIAAELAANGGLAF